MKGRGGCLHNVVEDVLRPRPIIHWTYLNSIFIEAPRDLFKVQNILIAIVRSDRPASLVHETVQILEEITNTATAAADRPDGGLVQLPLQRIRAQARDVVTGLVYREDARREGVATSLGLFATVRKSPYESEGLHNNYLERRLGSKSCFERLSLHHTFSHELLLPRRWCYAGSFVAFR